MTTTVMGIYGDRHAADAAVQALVAAEFPRECISIIVRNTPQYEELVRRGIEDNKRGAITGAVTGAAITSILAGALALPAIGLLAAGPLVAVLGGGGAGAAAGSVVGALVGHDLSGELAARYDAEIEAGAILLALHTVRARAKEARNLLTATGGQDVADGVHFGHGNPTDGAGGSP